MAILISTQSAFSASDDRIDCELQGRIKKGEGRFYRLPNTINLSFDISADVLGSDLFGVEKSLVSKRVQTPLSQPTSSLIKISKASLVKTRELLTSHPIDIDAELDKEYKVKLKKIHKNNVKEIIYSLGYRKEIDAKANRSLNLFTATNEGLVDTKSVKFKKIDVEVEFDFSCQKQPLEY